MFVLSVNVRLPRLMLLRYRVPTVGAHICVVVPLEDEELDEELDEDELEDAAVTVTV